MNKKNLIDLIKKFGQDLELPDAPGIEVKPTAVPAKTAPQAAPAAPAIPTTQTAPSARPVVSNFATVKAMQSALVNLAKVVTDQFATNTSGTEKAPVARTSFHDFITQNYLRKSPVKGKEFGSNADPTKMSGIMDSMSRLGSTKNDFAIDGNWGPKTNAALQNANAFAYAMLKLAADFKLPIKSYNEEMLGKFVVPESDTSITVSEKAVKAKEFTDQVAAITKMYEEVKAGVLNNPTHKEYIEGKPFVSYKKSTPLSAYDKDIAARWTERLPENTIPFNIQQPDGSLLGATINYADLLSADSFKKWYDNGDNQQLKQPNITHQIVLDAVRKALEAKSATAAPGAV